MSNWNTQQHGTAMQDGIDSEKSALLLQLRIRVFNTLCRWSQVTHQQPRRGCVAQSLHVREGLAALSKMQGRGRIPNGTRVLVEFKNGSFELRRSRTSECIQAPLPLRHHCYALKKESTQNTSRMLRIIPNQAVSFHRRKKINVPRCVLTWMLWYISATVFI